MIKYKDEINTGMKSLNDLGAVLKFCDHTVIGPIHLVTFTIFKLLAERISCHSGGLLVSIY